MDASWGGKEKVKLVVEKLAKKQQQKIVEPKQRLELEIDMLLGNKTTHLVGRIGAIGTENSFAHMWERMWTERWTRHQIQSQANQHEHITWMLKKKLSWIRVLRIALSYPCIALHSARIDRRRKWVWSASGGRNWFFHFYFSISHFSAFMEAECSVSPIFKFTFTFLTIFIQC